MTESPPREDLISPRLRNWLFLIATALLYMGPLLAGLSDYGWGVMPFFVVVFLVWLALMRPGLYPASGSGWTGRTWAALAGWAAVQVALVIFCFAVGRGVGGVLGALPALPLWLTLGLSTIAIPLARLFRPAPLTPEMEAFIDAATRELDEASRKLDEAAAAAPDAAAKTAPDATSDTAPEQDAGEAGSAPAQAKAKDKGDA
ncbi:hypothetical protein [Acidimangrovimonas pyrenivorans]|uniref:Uncharacterized protein n=1 Tax=Acidimangrovimonas pyrenivorans TaxID=2030798 RepID=A0ABV7AM71_9RHOB